MKNSILTTVCALLAAAVLAQAPQGISHQAVIRNAANELVTNAPIGIQVSIIQGSADGMVVYSETHTPTSNTNGLTSFVIGQGTIVSGVFAGINWAIGPFFIKTQADPTGGTNYAIEGISQMLSVPYAFNSSSLTITSPNGNPFNIKVDDNGKIFANISNCPYSIVDIDGNTYNVIAIGGQCWMKENLKTTKYRNGTPIPHITSSVAWTQNITGAYTLYNNDISWKESYGALYNWLAVNNANGLCPTGWHVPSDAEWSQLVNYVVAQGFTNDGDNPNGAGNALKSCRQVDSPLSGDCNTSAHPRWNSHDTHHGFDELGFSGLPGGHRTYLANFHNLGYDGNFWSSTELSPISSWARILYSSISFVSRHDFYKTNGFSVRCVKD